MKVREYIEQLKTLDQERNIWLEYDGVSMSEPSVRAVDEYEASEFADEGVKEGDYAI